MTLLGAVSCIFISQSHASPTLPLVEKLAAGGDDTAPIVVVLHGLGDTPDAFINFMQPLVPGTRVVALQAPRKRRQGGYSWYRIKSPHVTNDIQHSVSLVVDTLQALQKRYPKAGLPTLIGFSQGAVISLKVATNYTNIARTVVGIAGYIEATSTVSLPSSSPGPSILVVHGRADNIIKYERGVRAYSKLRAAGYTADLLTHDAGHRVPANALTEIQHWLVERLVQSR